VVCPLLPYISRGQRVENAASTNNSCPSITNQKSQSLLFSPWVLGSEVRGLRVLRLTRLMRLLDFIQKVPDLRVMMGGLAAAQKSVGYILMLLLLVDYIFAVGKRDTALGWNMRI
jgi:hypothetical protein